MLAELLEDDEILPADMLYGKLLPTLAEFIKLLLLLGSDGVEQSIGV